MEKVVVEKWWVWCQKQWWQMVELVAKVESAETVGVRCSRVVSNDTKFSYDCCE